MDSWVRASALAARVERRPQHKCLAKHRMACDNWGCSVCGRALRSPFSSTTTLRADEPPLSITPPFPGSRSPTLHCAQATKGRLQQMRQHRQEELIGHHQQGAPRVQRAKASSALWGGPVGVGAGPWERCPRGRGEAWLGSRLGKKKPRSL